MSPKKLAKTRTAKSVHDAGWSMLPNMVSYKSIATGGVMRVVPEQYSSQMCIVRLRRMIGSSERSKRIALAAVAP